MLQLIQEQRNLGRRLTDRKPEIREARLDRIPYMLVVGEKEEAEGSVSVRSRFAGDEGSKKLSDFVDMICKEIRTKEIRKEEVTE